MREAYDKSRGFQGCNARAREPPFNHVRSAWKLPRWTVLAPASRHLPRLSRAYTRKGSAWICLGNMGERDNETLRFGRRLVMAHDPENTLNSILLYF